MIIFLLLLYKIINLYESIVDFKDKIEGLMLLINVLLIKYVFLYKIYLIFFISG